MPSHGAIIFIGIFIQVILALLTTNDAKKRGHDPIGWLIVTLFLGVLGVLFYLLTRNDQVIPEEERPDSEPIKFLFLYGFVLFVGFFIFLFIGTLITPLFSSSQAAAAESNTLVGFVGMIITAVAVYAYRRNGESLRADKKGDSVGTKMMNLGRAFLLNTV